MPPRRASTGLQEDLLSNCESGMGYQIAEIQSDLVTTWFLVLNAEVAFPLPEFIPINRLGFWIPFREKLSNSDIRWLYDSIEPASATSEPETAANLDELRGTVSRVLTHGSYASTSRPGESFVRYTAFHRDRRINSDGSVPSGTYVTTQTERPHVPSGLAAVSRYSLPNPTPALYTFTISPPSGVDLWCGTVVPKFGQAGGGVEVLFNAPLPPGTAHGPKVIPER